ncbi:tRNA-dihydrouridine synthase [Tepiditoga spiralis]|uniref:tRNA-dihydrouridine synthase n=1 Tax=Tepiditoga spiralis TaxID=2108365 RepID=A0A7G1G4X2_9BACT|nr:tRNA-dihydrouridine synthase family protein [Tepiditoga spiralis]BBE31600.1 tRNA-dihydrouridine synthase [Tepiditoga spiralis]
MLFLDKKIILAPMADYSDFPFREICRKHGANFTYTEMISADAIYKNIKKSFEYLPMKKEKNIGIQLFGSSVISITEAAKIIEDRGDWIDINAGCPVKKVVKKGAGSALLTNHKNLFEIVYGLKKVVKKPVGVKIRIGYDKINVFETAKIIEDAGADYLIIHGRLQSQLYSGTSNRELIREVKERVNIPVGASGDVFSFEDVTNYMKVYNADFVLAARGTIGNPWFFENKIPSIEERIETIIKHLELSIKYYKNEIFAIKKFKKILIAYLKGLPNSRQLKEKIVLINDFNKIKEILLKANF